MTSPFACIDHRQITALVRAYPLAWAVTHEAAAWTRAPVPLVPECDATGAMVALIGHLARTNPHAAVSMPEPRHSSIRII